MTLFKFYLARYAMYTVCDFSLLCLYAYVIIVPDMQTLVDVAHKINRTDKSPCIIFV